MLLASLGAQPQTRAFRRLRSLACAGCLAGTRAGGAPRPWPPPPPPPPAVAPPAPAPPAVPSAVSRALHRDTAVVRQNARQCVARPSTSADKVETLEPLTRAMNRALAVMEGHRARAGHYRPADVRAARAAADAVARFLDAQPPPRETETEPKQ